MKKLLVVALAGISTCLSAQTIDNLSLLNSTGLHGSPRYSAMGGAFTALGNDFSSIHLNPAGASVFRRDQLGLSLGFQGRTDRTQFLNGSNESSSFDLLFENVGLVKKFGNNDAFTFAISYNKMADFNRDYGVSGSNPFIVGNDTNYTLGEYWLAGAFNRTMPEMESAGLFEEASAASAGVLLVDSLGAFIYDYYPDAESDVSYSFRERGSRNEALISLGSQVNDRFYFGFAVGIPNLSYRQSTVLTESGFADSSYITSYSLEQSNDVYGNGINLKLGVIGRPTDWLRLGLSYQSPSWYSISETYALQVEATAVDQSFVGTEYIFDDIRYSVRTPAIIRSGLAVVFAKQGLISIDYEYSDPTSLNLNSRDGTNYEQAESSFLSVVQPVNTFKLGGEYRIGPTFIRAGYRIRESLFTNPASFYSDQTNYSVGFGYSNEDFAIDLAYTYTEATKNNVTHAYLGDNLDGNEVSQPERTLVTNDISKGNLIIGATFRF